MKVIKLTLSYSLLLLLSILPFQACQRDNSKKVTHDAPLTFYSNELRVAGNLWTAGDKIGIFAFSQGETFGTSTPKATNLAYTTKKGGAVASFVADLMDSALFLPKNKEEAFDIVAYYPYTQNQQGENLPVVREGDKSFPDILYSDNAKALSAETHSSTSVLLAFRHYMSRIQFQVINESGNRVDGATVLLTNIPTAGSFSLSTKTFSFVGSSKSSIRFVQDAKQLYTACLVPHLLSESNKVEIVHGNKTYKTDLPATIRDLQPGKSYKLTLLLLGATGEIVVAGNAFIEDRETGEVTETTLTPQEPSVPSNPTLPSEENNYLGENVTSGDPKLLEMPRPSGGSHNYLVTHKVDGEVNYSVEFDTSLRTPRFVAFTFNKKNSQKNVGRNDAWGWYPLIPSRFETSRSDFSGYSRGHLVASNDRVSSLAANKQTFYYSNMALQLQNHNSGIWLTFEKLLQSWAREKGMAEGNKVLYVAKGITCDANKGNNFVMAYGTTGIPVAKYFWMAVVYYDGANYYSIAFLTEHDKPSTQRPLKKYAMSVDELEAFIGQDLFFNFPDAQEEAFESQLPEKHLDVWPGI